MCTGILAREIFKVFAKGKFSVPKQMGRNQIIGIVGGLVLLISGILGIAFFRASVPTAENLAAKMAAALEELQTVQGKLLLGQDDQMMEYELWVQRPRHLRAEAELQGVEGKAVFILVFNENEAWTYNPVLRVATVADRTKPLPEDGGRAGTSLLETMPEDVLTVLRAGDVQIIGDELVAGRNALRVQVLLPVEQNPFANPAPTAAHDRADAGAVEIVQLTIWLDKSIYYPLAIADTNCAPHHSTDAQAAPCSGFHMHFDFIKFNEAIDPLTFVFFPPPGEPVRRVGE